MGRMFEHCLAYFFIFYFFFPTLCEANQYLISSHDQSVASKNFWQLNRMLGYYEHAKLNPWPQLPTEPQLLKRGKKGKAVLILRERLRRSGDLDPEFDTKKNIFDRNLADAVASYQARHG